MEVGRCGGREGWKDVKMKREPMVVTYSCSQRGGARGVARRVGAEGLCAADLGGNPYN